MTSLQFPVSGFQLATMGRQNPQTANSKLKIVITAHFLDDCT